MNKAIGNAADAGNRGHYRNVCAGRRITVSLGEHLGNLVSAYGASIACIIVINVPVCEMPRFHGEILSVP